MFLVGFGEESFESDFDSESESVDEEVGLILKSHFLRKWGSLVGMISIFSLFPQYYLIYDKIFKYNP